MLPVRQTTLGGLPSTNPRTGARAPMLLTITYGTASGESAHLDVEPDATPMDVLNALTEAQAFNVNSDKERYVVSSPRLGHDLNPNDRLAEVGIQDNDMLTVSPSETGYQP